MVVVRTNQHKVANRDQNAVTFHDAVHVSLYSRVFSRQRSVERPNSTGTITLYTMIFIEVCNNSPRDNDMD